MTAAQIIIVSIPLFILLISVLKLLDMAFRSPQKKPFIDLLFIFSILSIVFLIFILYSLTEYNTKLRKQIKGKCPEYEKIENVYRLK